MVLTHLVLLVQIFLASEAARSQINYELGPPTRNDSGHVSCIKADQTSIIITGPLDETLIKTAQKAKQLGIDYGLAVSGKDLLKPIRRANRRRNFDFIKEAFQGGATIVALPWKPIRNADAPSVELNYKKSISAISQALGTDVKTILLPVEQNAKNYSKHLDSVGYTILGNLKSFDYPEPSNLITELAGGPDQLQMLTKDLHNSMIQIVSLKECIGVDASVGKPEKLVEKGKFKDLKFWNFKRKIPRKLSSDELTTFRGRRRRHPIGRIRGPLKTEELISIKPPKQGTTNQTNIVDKNETLPFPPPKQTDDDVGKVEPKKDNVLKPVDIKKEDLVKSADTKEKKDVVKSADAKKKDDAVKFAAIKKKSDNLTFANIKGEVALGLMNSSYVTYPQTEMDSDSYSYKDIYSKRRTPAVMDHEPRRHYRDRTYP